MAAAKKRVVSRSAWLFALAALLLAAFAAVLGTGKTCHLYLHVDSSRMSETLEQAFVRNGLDIAPLLAALETDDDVSPAELHGEHSLLNARLDTMRELSFELDDALQWLAERNIGKAVDDRYTVSLHRLNEGAEWLGIGLTAASFTTLGLLVLGLVLLCLRHPCGAASAAMPAALLAGTATLLPVSMAGRLMNSLSENFSVVRLYGVGYAARLSLTDSGKAQVLLCAGALLFSACSLLLATRIKRKKRSQPAR